MIAQPVEQIAPLELTRRRFTVDEYLRMAEVGLLTEDDKVELIQGEIIKMSPINVAHASVVKRLIRLLSKALGDRAILSAQDPVQLTNDSLPQPDITLLQPQHDFYSWKHPGPESVLLLIEVSDTTLNYDRRTKGALYAAAGIAEYWIVNLPARQIEAYREPRPTGYRTTTIYSPGEVLTPLTFPDVALNVDDILGPKS